MRYCSMTRDPNRDGITKDINVLPSPESDHDPQLTKFVLDIGDFYNKCVYPDWRNTPSRKKRDFNRIAKYLSDAFIEVLKKELKID